MKYKQVMIPHYVAPDYRGHGKNTYLDDNEYGRALDTFVKACVDAVIVRKREGENGALGWEMLLGRRNIEPQKDWWTFGGRMKAGESPIDCLHRNLVRDLQLNSHECKSVEFLTLGSFVWGRREQEPKHHGSCDIILFHLVHLQDPEKMYIWEPKEYDEVKWFTFAEIETTNNMHPSLQTLVKEVLQKMT